MRPPGSVRSLRSIFSLVVVIVGALVLLSTGALVATTSVMERTTSETAAAVESVRLTEEAEISLLLHARADDPLVRQDIETELRESLDSAQAHVTSVGERGILQYVESSVDRYLRAPATEATGAGTTAFTALEHLVAINLAQARAMQAEAHAWAELAKLVGIILGTLFVATVIGLVLWLRRRVIRPWFALADTLRRFGEGQRAERAEERGPLELREMSRRFNEMAESIATQRQAQVAFVGGVAHDLRTPLSALGLAVDLLAPEEPLPAEPQLRRTISTIARQIHQLERMVGDFVDMSTSEAGTLQLHVGEHDLRAIVRDAVRLFSQADGMQERFRISVPDEPSLVRCDDVRVGQAVTNLVSNAIKYSPAKEQIEVRVDTDATNVIIEVTDHGAGIAHEDQRKIFEPFRRVGASDRAKGAGLGLFNVARIVDAHGGRVEVVSAPAHGSTFRIRLPRA